MQVCRTHALVCLPIDHPSCEQVLMDMVWVWPESGPHAEEESRRKPAPIDPLVTQLTAGLWHHGFNVIIWLARVLSLDRALLAACIPGDVGASIRRTRVASLISSIMHDAQDLSIHMAHVNCAMQSCRAQHSQVKIKSGKMPGCVDHAVTPHVCILQMTSLSPQGSSMCGTCQCHLISW